jgi:hypothetical protein
MWARTSACSSAASSEPRILETIPTSRVLASPKKYLTTKSKRLSVLLLSGTVASSDRTWIFGGLSVSRLQGTEATLAPGLIDSPIEP